MGRSKPGPRSSGIFDLLGVGQESANPPAASTGDAQSGATAGGDIARIPLAQLRLDLAQPRRPLPLIYASAVNSGALTLVAAVAQWARDAGVALTLDVDPDAPLAKGAGRILDEIRRELAPSVREVGLINPITVVAAQQGHYAIETGERRALAHALLVACGHSEFDSVPAQIVERGEIARRQFEENEARQDLTAVQKARLWWAARYRLSGRGRIDWSRFDGAENLNTVLGSEDKGELVPWARVEEYLKRSKQSRIYSLRVLELPAAAIALAEAYSLSEKVLRPVLEQHAGDPARQLALVQEEAQRLDAGEVSSSRQMARRVAKPADKPETSAAQGSATGYRRALGSLDKLTGGRALPQKEIKRLTEALSADQDIVEAARRLKPLIDRLAGQ